MATRHQLPFNNALMEKIFDRLDPMNTGNIYWEECVEFLEKALPGYQDTSKPSKPPWETKKPLKPITVDLPIKESPMTKTSGRKNSKADTFPYSDFVSEKRYVDNNSREMPQDNRSEENYGRKEKKTRRPESRLEKYILLIKDLRKRADPKTNLLDAEEARRLLQSYDVMFELGMPNKVINEIIERSDFDGTVDVNDVIGYVGGY